ncbi:uncharacterized protein [Garra rufa]|uniref:uncharacterized protein n=1 Tax=Garra rufa TaxID=137080 RepID=UPI003CCE741B
MGFYICTLSFYFYFFFVPGTSNLYEKSPDVETLTEEEESKGEAEKQKEKSYKRKRSKVDRSSEDSDDPDLFSASTRSQKKPGKKPSFYLYENSPDVETLTEEEESKGEAEKRKEKSYKRKRSKVDRSSEDSDDPDLFSASTRSQKKPGKKPSFYLYENSPDVETLTEEEESKGEAEKRKEKSYKRKKSLVYQSSEDSDDPDLFSASTRSQKKPGKKPSFYLYENSPDVETLTEEEESKGEAEKSSSVKKGDEQEIWTLPLYKTQLPVTCGDKEGTVYRDKLPGGEKCIFSQKRWFTPNDFEKFGGMAKRKNWKFSIRCENIPLKKLIQDGHLQCPQRKRRKKTCVQKHMNDHFSISTNKRSSKDSKTNFGLVEESDSEDFQEQGGKKGGTEFRERDEEEEEDMADMSVFQAPSLPVTCVSLTGTLYKCRFASGSRGKCIRTEERWFTPEEFVKQEPTFTDGHWKKDILCHGKTLNFLHQKKVLRIHSLLCECGKCSTQEKDVMAQNNDDECFVCDSEEDLVCCDKCPRAFHSDCHIPAVDEDSPGEWICTFCMLKNSKKRPDPSTMSEQEAFKAPVSQYILHCRCLLLCVYREDNQKVFVEDPCKKEPRYSEFITQPMWLDKIKQKLESGSYRTVEAFVSDIQLIFNNCSTFNGDNEHGRMGARLKEMFEKEFQKIFSITQEKKCLVEESDPQDFQEQGGRGGGGKEFRGRVEEDEEEEEDIADLSVFEAPSLPVTCVSLTGTLYKDRFASGRRGKCIRTEERWFTPEEFVKQEPTLTDGHWKKDILCHGKTLNFLLQEEILHIHPLLCECKKCSTQEEDVLAQNNDDECYVCRSEGDLMCCDECPRAFHSDCHIPAVDGDSPGEWICTFCMLKNSKKRPDPSNMSDQEAFKAPVSQYILHCRCLLLCVYREDNQKVFVEDPCKTIRRYSEFITQPMWLDKIKQKLESGLYRTVEAFISDFQLIFNNCSRFNRDNYEFDQMGDKLKEKFEEEIQKIFKNTEVFTPTILKGNDKDKHKNVYRFECPYAGQFRCSLTSLVFVMEGEGEVLYKTVSWDPRLLDGLGKMEPAGPLYDIDCFDGPISGLHLPHCEIFSEKDMDFLAVAHFTDGNVAIMNPLQVTKAHVMIGIQHLSIFGLIKRMIFPPSPVIAQVLVFQRPRTERQRENVLDVHLLPWNVPLSEVKDQHVENMHIKTSSKCHLNPGTYYHLCCQPKKYRVQPETEVFEFNFGPNYHPTFEVFVDVRKEKVKLSLKDNTESREVWPPRQILLTVTSGQEVERPAHRQLTESEFVDNNRHHLIQRVSSVMEIADGLRAKNMISHEMNSEVQAIEPHQKQMRLLFKALDSGGASVKAEFYRLLKKKEPKLVNDLISESSRPQ